MSRVKYIFLNDSIVCVFIVLFLTLLRAYISAGIPCSMMELSAQHLQKIEIKSRKTETLHIT